jgi:hypothetical protein
MSPAHIDELNPETRAKVRQRIGETEGGPTALATVPKESFTTLDDMMAFSAALKKMTNDQLADVVIEGIKKLQHYLPYIQDLKDRFDRGDRDSTNRLRTPIKNCYSWQEFCQQHLDRTPQAIGKALAAKAVPKPAVNDPLGEVFKKINVLLPYSGDGEEHKFVVNAENMLQMDICPEQQEEAKLVLWELEKVSEACAGYAERLKVRLHTAGIANALPSLTDEQLSYHAEMIQKRQSGIKKAETQMSLYLAQLLQYVRGVSLSKAEAIKIAEHHVSDLELLLSCAREGVQRIKHVDDLSTPPVPPTPEPTPETPQPTPLSAKKKKKRSLTLRQQKRADAAADQKLAISLRYEYKNQVLAIKYANEETGGRTLTPAEKRAAFAAARVTLGLSHEVGLQIGGDYFPDIEILREPAKEAS